MRRSLLALAGIVFAGCTMHATATPLAPPTAPKATLGTWGVDLNGMDKSVKPGDNFFEFVNGNWVKTATIPGRPLQHRLVPGSSDFEREAFARDRR